MKNLTVIGLDLAKNVFQVHGMDDRGHKVCGARLKRSEVLSYFANLPPVLVGMEACGGAHEWARQLCKLGHQVKMMAPQHVKAYVQGNKTDARDAAAIAEAANRESVRTVAVRSVESQQMQAIHRVRELWMKQRVALGNQIRGLLAEFGEVMPLGLKKLKQEIALWQERASEELAVIKELIGQLLDGLRALEERISLLELKIKLLHKNNAASRLIESIPASACWALLPPLPALGIAASSRVHASSPAVLASPRESTAAAIDKYCWASANGVTATFESC